MLCNIEKTEGKETCVKIIISTSLSCSNVRVGGGRLRGSSSSSSSFFDNHAVVFVVFLPPDLRTKHSTEQITIGTKNRYRIDGMISQQNATVVPTYMLACTNVFKLVTEIETQTWHNKLDYSDTPTTCESPFELCDSTMSGQMQQIITFH